MIQFKAFEVLVGIISGSRKRATAEHMDFLEFYKSLVNIVEADIARDFGSVAAPVTVKGKAETSFRLELNATDLLWWQSVIVSDGGRFTDGVASIQRAIWDQLNKQADKASLTDEQRQQLLQLTFDANG